VSTVIENVTMGAGISALVESVAELFAEDSGRRDPLMDQGWPTRDGADHYTGLMDDPACLLVLARDAGMVTGHLVGRITGPGALLTEPVAVLESMRVAPAARGTGAGTLLVRHFFAWAREHGARHASVSAYAANSGAQRFYERHGFTPLTVTSRVSL
jgi:GNAT superfamily N-acetyltransferase